MDGDSIVVYVGHGPYAETTAPDPPQLGLSKHDDYPAAHEVYKNGNVVFY